MLRQPPQSSMRFSHEALFFLSFLDLFTLSSHCSQYISIHNHLFVTSHSTCIPLRCIVFCFYRVVGVVVCSGLLVESFVFPTLTSRPRRVTHQHLLVFFVVACLPHCTTLSPFTLRRASRLKPPNIYHSPSLSSFHCKIYTPHSSHFTHASFPLTRL